jgi:hypothetical protein
MATSAISAQQNPLTSDGTPALACIQNALGGTAAFAAVTSLHIQAEKRPLQQSGMRPAAGTREINVVFPDRYRRDEVGRPFRPGEGEIRSVEGFNKGVLLSTFAHPDPNRGLVLARQDFNRQMLMRLPRQVAGVRLSQRMTTDSGRERLAIEASGTAGVEATLLVDRATCVPVALLYTRVSSTFRGVARVDLSGYRLFGGIRFPTVLRTSRDGEPYQEERVNLVEVNSPTAARAFSGRR